MESAGVHADQSHICVNEDTVFHDVFAGFVLEHVNVLVFGVQLQARFVKLAVRLAGPFTVVEHV